MKDHSVEKLLNSLDFPASVKEAVKKSCVDQRFKERLLRDPIATLKAEGYDLPAR